MDGRDFLNNMLGTLKSKKRLKILEILMENPRPMHFNEIFKQLSILPSTLEYHLKQLEGQNLLTHLENSYTTNAYSKLIWNALNTLSKLTPLLSYLKTHVFPMDDTELLFKFIISGVEVIPDMISMLTFMKEKMLTNISTIRLAGNFNLELEERMMQFSNVDFKIKEIEILTNYENFQKFLSYENFEYFLSFTPLENIKLFLIDECDYYAAIADNFGVLFLPDMDDTIDFQQCLGFNGATAIQWLNEIFDELKSRAKRVNLTEGFLKDVPLFLKYLRELDSSR